MKLVKATALTAVIASLAIGSAFATGVLAHQRDGGKGGARENMPSFAELDTDGSGGVSLDELKASHAVKVGEADTDGDGFLSVEELLAMADARMDGRMDDRMEHRGEGMGRGDRQGGKGWMANLSEEQQARRIEQMQEMRELRITHMIENRDTDGDGKLSISEMLPPQIETIFERLDADSDGEISQAEFEAAQHKMQGRRGDHGGEGHRGGHY